MSDKMCKDCVWFDRCGCEDACEYYCPASEGEQEADKEDTYRSDLRERHELYARQVEEQDF